jgi:hypothetical protein
MDCNEGGKRLLKSNKGIVLYFVIFVLDLLPCRDCQVQNVYISWGHTPNFHWLLLVFFTGHPVKSVKSPRMWNWWPENWFCLLQLQFSSLKCLVRKSQRRGSKTEKNAFLLCVVLFFLSCPIRFLMGFLWEWWFCILSMEIRNKKRRFVDSAVNMWCRMRYETKKAIAAKLNLLLFYFSPNRSLFLSLYLWWLVWDLLLFFSNVFWLNNQQKQQPKIWKYVTNEWKKSMD